MKVRRRCNKLIYCCFISFVHQLIISGEKAILNHYQYQSMIAVKKWNKFMKPNSKSRYIYFKNISEKNSKC